MYNMMIIVNMALGYIWKLLTVDPKSSHHKETDISFSYFVSIGNDDC